MQEEIDALKKEVAELKEILFKENNEGRQAFRKEVIFMGRVGFFGVAPTEQAGAIASPTAGVTIDLNARTAIDAIRVAIKNFGITA